jgi:hypothetical protein
LGVFIAPTIKPTVGEGCCRWAHRTVWCDTGHCPVRKPRHPTVRVLTVSTVGALISWGTGQSGAAPDRYCLLSGAPSGAALTLRELSAHCSRHCSLLQTTVGAIVVAPLGTPDSLVIHRTVRWILAECAGENPKVRSSELISLVHRTLSGGTSDSPVRQTRAHFDFLLLLSFEP